MRMILQGIRRVGGHQSPITGPINIIDLANLYSCSFIATDDIGRLHNNDRFRSPGPAR